MKNLKYWLEAKELKGTKDVLETASLFIESMSVFVADNSAPIKSADGRAIYTPDRLRAYCIMGSPWYLDENQQPAKHKRLLVKTAVALDTLFNLAVLNNSGVNEILIRHKDDIINVIETVGKADTKNHLITDGKGWKIAIDKIFNGDDTDRAILYLLATDDSNEKIKIPCTNMDKMLGAGFEKDYEALREKLNASVTNEAPAEQPAAQATPTVAAVSTENVETKKELPDPIKETINDLETLEKEAQKVVNGIMAEGIEAAKEIAANIPKMKLPPTPGEMAGGGISSSADTGMSTLGKVAVGVGVAAGVAVVGYGLYRAYNALFVDTEVTSGNFNGGDNNILGL